MLQDTSESVLTIIGRQVSLRNRTLRLSSRESHETCMSRCVCQARVLNARLPGNTRILFTHSLTPSRCGLTRFDYKE